MIDGMDLERALDLVAEWINQAKGVVPCSGALTVTESGIPDFRTPG
jgi:NAD-dependent SIR2 family protein deacetylase